MLRTARGMPSTLDLNDTSFLKDLDPRLAAPIRKGMSSAINTAFLITALALIMAALLPLAIRGPASSRSGGHADRTQHPRRRERRGSRQGDDQGMTTTVEIRFDIACPWCYLGKRDAAPARFPHADQIRTQWRAFELRPGHTTEPTRPLGEIMHADWGLPPDEITKIVERVAAAGRTEGLALAPQTV